MYRYDNYTDSFVRIDGEPNTGSTTVRVGVPSKEAVTVKKVELTDDCINKIAEAVVRKLANRKTENSSEKPNNCEHITEDGVTCARYPACDDCPDNPLNKVKGSERLVKGSEVTTDCKTCKYGQDKHRYAHICNECGVGINNYTPQTDAEISKNALRSDCTGCRFVGTYDTEFPCANCARKNKDYYDAWQTDCEDIYPLVIIEDRYTGVYSNGKYTAWNMYFEDIPREIDEDDTTCRNFWHEYEGIVGLGNTPNEAVKDLRRKIKGRAENE